MTPTLEPRDTRHACRGIEGGEVRRACCRPVPVLHCPGHLVSVCREEDLEVLQKLVGWHLEHPSTYLHSLKTDTGEKRAGVAVGDYSMDRRSASILGLTSSTYSVQLDRHSAKLHPRPSLTIGPSSYLGIRRFFFIWAPHHTKAAELGLEGRMTLDPTWETWT